MPAGGYTGKSIYQFFWVVWWN